MKYLKTIISVCLLFWSVLLLAQAPAEKEVKGIVVNAKGEALIAVNLQLEETYDGTTTDIDGTFYFTSTEQDSQTLVISYFGFEDDYLKIDMNSPNIQNLTITYREKSIELDEIVVQEVKEFKSTEKARTTVLGTIDVLSISADGDMQTAFKTFPGVQPIEESGGLFIRGGTNEETQTFVDGMRIDKFTYTSPSNVGAQSRFSPNMFKGMYLSSGNYSALYGQAISSALILETEDLPTKSSVDFGISPLFVEGGAQLLAKNKQSTGGVTFNYTNGGLVLNNFPTNLEFTQPQENINSTYNYKHKLGEAGIIKYYGNLAFSKVGVKSSNLENPFIKDETFVKNQNFFNQVSYKHTFESDWALSLGSSYLRNIDKFKFTSTDSTDGTMTSDTDLYESTDLFQLRAVATRYLRKAKFNFGAEYQYTKNHFSHDVFAPDRIRLEDNYIAAFAEYNRAFTNKLTLSVGSRFEHYSVLNKRAIMPRLTLTYAPQKNALVYASWGEFTQKPNTQYLYQTNDLDLQQSQQYTIGFQKSNNYRMLRVEAFYKKYNSLLKYSPDLTNDGNGLAQGVELFWKDRKTFKAFQYWVSYSFLDTKRNYLNYPIAAQPNFAMKHVASLTLKKFVPKIMTNFGVTYSYGSGRPYFNPNLPTADFMSTHTMDYHNVNLNIAYLPKIKNTFSVLVLTVSNVIGNKQVFNYEYAQTDFSVRRPVLPFIKRLVFVGLFVNLGVDRTDDIINRELN